ncbi:hypothetical protein ACS8FY_003607 [Vibrio parahaemolyticus]
MKPLHIDPAVIESQIGEKLNAVRVLGLSSSEVLDDLMGHLNQHFQTWLFEFLNELSDRVESGDPFTAQQTQLPQDKSKTTTTVKVTRKK